MNVPAGVRARAISTVAFSDADLETARTALQAWLDARDQEEVLAVDWETDGSAHYFVVYFTEG